MFPFPLKGREERFLSSRRRRERRVSLLPKEEGKKGFSALEGEGKKNFCSLERGEEKKDLSSSKEEQTSPSELFLPQLFFLCAIFNRQKNHRPLRAGG